VLASALEAGLDGDDRARALASRASVRLLRADPGALGELDEALAAARDPALRLQVEARALEGLGYFEQLTERRRELLARGAAGGEPSPVMLAALTQDAAYASAPVDATLDWARRALDAGLMTAVGPASNTFVLFVHALRYAEQADMTRALLDEGEAALLRSGERFTAFYIDHVRAYWHLFFGSVASAGGHALSGLQAVRSAGLDLSVAAFVAIASEVLVEQDRLAEAAELFAPVDLDALAPTVSGPFALTARGVVRTLQGDRSGAEGDLRRALASHEARGWRAPMVARTGLRLALLLGPGEEAERLTATAEGLARAAGTRGALGSVLRTRGVLAGGEDGIALLQQAVAELEVSPLLLERGWALHDLGAALRRAGRPSEAREPLREALDLAARVEGALLSRRVTEELAASGARPRRTALSGPEALTPSERRVAELAAAGRSNREIAEALWVTRKTVEMHLGRTYGKLGSAAAASSHTCSPNRWPPRPGRRACTEAA
jgi:DNA-binding CsgD family transcriptional regulator